jgi:3-oxoadipate enol-lactonase
VSLCGLSLGGLVGMWTAATAPERIDGLALCCTSARFGKREYWLERAAIARTRGMSAVAEIVLPRWFTAGFESRRPDAFARFASTLLAIPPEGYAGCCEAIADADLRGSLGAIRAPTLVIAGAEDPSLPPADAELIQSGIAGARLTVLPGAAHLAAAERPEAVARAVLDHLAAATTAQER